MQQNKLQKNSQEKEIICRKCNALYLFLWIVFVIVLLFMFLCLFSLDLGSAWNSSALQFFFLIELIIIIGIFESYVDILIIWKNWIRFESWILVKNKKEIPYDKINSINIHSAFWLWTLEVMAGNDEIVRYKFLNNYEEVGKIIKEYINKK